MKVLWPFVAREFTLDGPPMCNIRVCSNATADCQIILDFVRQHTINPVFSVDAEPAEWPDSAADAFAITDRAHPLLTFWCDDVYVQGNFFVEEEIYLGLRRDSVRNQQNLDSLLSFLQSLGDVLAKPVCVAPDDCMDEPFNEPFITYLPADKEFRATPFPGERYESTQPSKDRA